MRDDKELEANKKGWVIFSGNDKLPAPVTIQPQVEVKEGTDGSIDITVTFKE